MPESKREESQWADNQLAWALVAIQAAPPVLALELGIRLRAPLPRRVMALGFPQATQQVSRLENLIDPWEQESLLGLSLSGHLLELVCESLVVPKE